MSIIASDAECTQTENNVSEASHTDAAWPLIPPTSSTQDEEPAEGGKGNKDPNSASGGGTNQVESKKILNIGRQEEICGFCTAHIWAAEFTGRHVGTGPKGYSICCGKGKVQLPLLRETPPELNYLIGANETRSSVYFSKSRVYNNIFAFCSFGGNVDHSVNNGKGPYDFRVCGRTYHSLSSLTPKFAQLYMYDGQEAVDSPVKLYRKGRGSGCHYCLNVAHERFTGAQPEQIHLRLFERRTSDGRFQNVPTANDYEFAGIVVDNDFANKRDIVVKHKRNGLQHISELHPSFMSLQYPLLFPFGEDGYRIYIKHRNANNSESEKDAVMERVRLVWVQRHQSIIKSDLYNNIVDNLRRGDVDATEVGRRVILLSSFTGGYRYMQQNFQESLAVSKEYGHPDLFITFTCNPKWYEIEEAIRASGSHSASVRPNIMARVFKMKLNAMLNDFTKKHVLRRVLAVVYTVEFQKRGLPHAHIVLWLGAADKLLTPEDIDNVISAEIADKKADPIGYKAVSQLMMHGPCGPANPKCPCISNGRCTKLYPKSFSDKMAGDADGYALYRRRDTKACCPISSWIVGEISRAHKCWCNRSLSIKYLFKYIGKSPDTATARLENANQNLCSNSESSSTLKTSSSDEVSNYLSRRYVSAAESCWRLFEFPIHHREPFVQRLYFHLENEQVVRFRDNETLSEVVHRVDPDGTMFIQWMLSNRYDNLGHNLTFIKYPTKF
ncbi:uncharacterized protein LOC141696181 [Apium graveolens]|uniref:uncharacterized protein LOC141696181 n=1 Tax=Apium graveolens TaxID=4045 RepID=UPI003D7AA677